MPTKETELTAAAAQILDKLRKVVVGKDTALVWVLAAILAGGHILLEDIPGVGKTTLALAFSKALGLSYRRVQFTPDVLPSDITGYSVPDRADGTLRYQAGAVVTNLFLADELNRATSRTQSALLEAMEEGQVTVDGIRHPLPEPFVVIATQNPTGAAGTQLLPDSQMDRFLIRLSLGYPEPGDEAAMLLARREGNPMDRLTQVLSREDLIRLRRQVESIYISEPVAAYMVALTGATRTCSELTRGASPRGTLALAAMSRAVAGLRGRDYVTPADVKEVFIQTTAHRIEPSAGARAAGTDPRDILKKLMESVPAPRLH